MLKKKVKASAITNLTDARYFAAWEVEWMGFNLSPGEDTFISPTEVLAIKEWVEGPNIVGEFSLSSAEEIELLARDLELHAIQVGMATPLETLLELETTLPIIKEVVVEKGMTAANLESLMQDFAPQVQFFLLDFSKNGWVFQDWEQDAEISRSFMQQLLGQYPVILAMDLSPEELEALLAELPLAGLALRGGAEEKVGYKSYDELDEVLEELEELI